MISNITLITDFGDGDGYAGAVIGAVKSRNRISGEVIDIDKYGNLITNIEAESIGNGSAKMEINLNNIGNIRFHKTFSDVNPQNPMAYIGSLGFLEIAVNLNRADEIMDAGIGSAVEVAI